MNLPNKSVIQALEPLGYPVAFLVYTGTLDKYFTFQFDDERGELFADDFPQEEVYSLQLHFFAPRTFNHLSLKKQVKNNLFNAGWNYPTCYTQIEEDGQVVHLIFYTEKEYFNG